MAVATSDLAVIATKILQIILRYKLQGSSSNHDLHATHSDAYWKIHGYVARFEPIRMCLPAFPFKSPNNISKVLGVLPDKAEEISLALLNGICNAISDVYPPGARLMIISDGLVYNDLLTVPDRNVWSYGQGLRSMVHEKGFSNIEFSRLSHLLNGNSALLSKHSEAADLETSLEADEIFYVTNATNFRIALLSQFGTPDYDSSAAIKESEDTCLTYRGYIKFLETDLKYVYPVGEMRSKSQAKKGISRIAKEMLRRGDAFAHAVRAKFPDHVRLSIHRGTGERKVSISLLPTDSIYTTPWHSTIAFRIDGTVETGPREFFDHNPAYELVQDDRTSRPSHFRERSDFYAWGAGQTPVVFEPLYPSGMLIRPTISHSGKPVSLGMADIDSVRLRALTERVSPIVLRGFRGTGDRDGFIAKAHELGAPLPWKFGLLLEVKDSGVDTRGLNNVLSAEWMPFHYDGLFKTEKQVDPVTNKEHLVSTPPRFQFFTAVTPSPPDTGFTLFTSSTSLFRLLPQDLPLSCLEGRTWRVSTGAFDATSVGGLPLVRRHPTTGNPCLQYHERWPSSRTRFEPTHVELEGMNEEENNQVCNILEELLHDRRAVYWHTWEKGDLLVSDNLLTMHTRSDFRSGADRELWRIHFD